MPARRSPVIAITSCAAPDDYLARVTNAGGAPRLIAPSSTGLGDASALLLTGGGDIEPWRYGESPHPADYEIDPARDDLEFELCRAALARDLPILGICRGLQVLNVVAGGTLVQDIPTQIAPSLDHRIPRPRDGLSHEIRVAPASRLLSLLQADVGGGRTCRVNTRHHQAIRRLGEGLVVTASAPDGVIEAVERSDARFCVAVQWHPENFVRTGQFEGLFGGLVQAAMRA